MKIAIDAGHGKYTAGKRCLKTIDPNETREWVLNNRVALKVIDLLSQYENTEILRMDDPTGETDIDLTTRCSKANGWGADIYVSLHHNAGGGYGIETFCHPSQGAGTEAYRLAQAVQSGLTAATGNRDRGVKQYDFAVCRQTNMPAILTELGFMDHPEDTPRILTEGYNTLCARGVVNGIAAYAGLEQKDTVTAPGPPENLWAEQEDGYLTFRYENAADGENNRVKNYHIYWAFSEDGVNWGGDFPADGGNFAYGIDTGSLNTACRWKIPADLLDGKHMIRFRVWAIGEKSNSAPSEYSPVLRLKAVKGDVNGDGKVDVSDVVDLRRQILKGE